MPSPIYQYVVYLVMSLPIRRGPGVLMNVPVLEHHALNYHSKSNSDKTGLKFKHKIQAFMAQYKEFCMVMKKREKQLNKTSIFVKY
jgi:hypothetical protein